MSAAPARGLRPAPLGGASAAVVAAALAAIVFAAGMVVLVDQAAVSTKLVLVGGLGLVAFALLAVARYDAAVAIGFVLSAVVIIEPAPVDGAFMIIIAVAAATGRFKLTAVPRSIQLFTLLLLALNILSMADAVSLSEAMRFFLITAYLVVFALWLCGYVDSERRARMIVVTWLIVAVISAVLGSLAINFGIPFRDLLIGDGASRAKALFKDPNVYGPFLVPIAVILLEQQIRPRILRLRGSTAAVLFTILTLGVLFSYSRAAWANMAMATVVMLTASAVTRRGGTRAVRALVGLLLAGCLVAGALGATGSIGFLQQRAQVQSYDTQRFAAQRAGVEMGWGHPVGVGPGQFQFHHNVESHSTYVRVLAEQGFGGLALWIALLLTTLVLALRNTVRGSHSYGIGAPALLGCWCGLVFNSVVVDTLHWRHLWVVAALIWVGAMREVRLRHAGLSGPRSGHVPATVGLVAPSR
jgi:O-antigen ligase